jgi:hypothetical protein
MAKRIEVKYEVEQVRLKINYTNSAISAVP